MICEKCVKTEKISLCTDSLVISEVPESLVEYIVWFKNLATGSLYGYKVESDSNKKLTLNFPEGFPLAGNTIFEIWVNKPGDSIESKIELFIDHRIAYCLYVQADEVQPMVTGYLDQPTSQTIKIKS